MQAPPGKQAGGPGEGPGCRWPEQHREPVRDAQAQTGECRHRWEGPGARAAQGPGPLSRLRFDRLTSELLSAGSAKPGASGQEVLFLSSALRVCPENTMPANPGLKKKKEPRALTRKLWAFPHLSLIFF